MKGLSVLLAIIVGVAVTVAGTAPARADAAQVQSEIRISLCADSPMAHAVIAGTTNVLFTRIKISNLCWPHKEVRIFQVRVYRSGISQDRNVMNLRLFKGATKLGPTRTLSRGKAIFPVNLVIPGCSCVFLDIYGDIAPDAPPGVQIALGINDVVAIEDDTGVRVKVVSGLPVCGWLMAVMPPK